MSDSGVPAWNCGCAIRPARISLHLSGAIQGAAQMQNCVEVDRSRPNWIKRKNYNMLEKENIRANIQQSTASLVKTTAGRNSCLSIRRKFASAWAPAEYLVPREAVLSIMQVWGTRLPGQSESPDRNLKLRTESLKSMANYYSPDGRSTQLQKRAANTRKYLSISSQGGKACKVVGGFNLSFFLV